MQKREEQILLRLYCVLTDIPAANISGSSQSTSFAGIFSFAKDMNAVKSPVCKVVHHLRVREYEDAEEYLTSLEAWIEKRKQSEWKDVFPFPQPD